MKTVYLHTEYDADFDVDFQSQSTGLNINVVKGVMLWVFSTIIIAYMSFSYGADTATLNTDEECVTTEEVQQHDSLR